MESINITFAGHGIWGVGGGEPDDGLTGFTIAKAELRAAKGRGNEASTGPVKLFVTLNTPEGGTIYDSFGLPSADAKAGTERAFTSFLLCVDFFGEKTAGVASALQANSKVLGGKTVALSVADLTGKTGNIHYMARRWSNLQGQDDDWSQNTYLLASEASDMREGKLTIKDSRKAIPNNILRQMGGAATTTAPAQTGVDLTGIGGGVAATQPVVAQPIVAAVVAQPGVTAQPGNSAASDIDALLN